MTAENNPRPQQNRAGNRNARQTSKVKPPSDITSDWIIQLIFQLILARIIYSLFTNAKRNLNVNRSQILNTFKNYFEPGELFDIYGVVTNDIRIDFRNLDQKGKVVYVNENKRYTHKRNNPYESTRVKIRPNDKFFNDLREHLYLTIFVIPHKAYVKKNELFYKSEFKKDTSGHYLVKTIPLTKVKKVTRSTTVRLVGAGSEEKDGASEDEADDDGEKEKKFWIPRLDINLVYDMKHHTPIRNDIYFEHFTKHHGERLYDPLLYLSQFWVLEEHLVPINTVTQGVSEPAPMPSTLDAVAKAVEFEKKLFLEDLVIDPAITNTHSVLSQPTLVQKDPVEGPVKAVSPPVPDSAPGDNGAELELVINYATCYPIYFMLLNNMSMTTSNNMWGIDNTKELDTIKKTLMNTNFYFLIFSVVFIILHTVFSVFALKNDIQFWYNNKSMEGLSSITLVINFVSEVIIGLYVYDNEKRSFLILFEIGLNIASSFWKLTKAIKVKFTTKYPFFVFTNQTSQVEDKTREYDRVAIKYMSMLLAPCIVGYAIYSLYYNKHKSWYSYIISVLAGSVYTFGFIMMTPQLYINYKLKSVEHLPWRALVYKSLNTFVDDVASFLIEMPMLHRLSCFRDDIIFFCYLYQRWKYKVDPNRNKNPQGEPPAAIGADGEPKEKAE